MFTLLPLGITAPFGTTILGWIAVSQIRRSAGKLYGMWLAVFDGLLFPLLLLDALTILVCRALIQMYVRPLGQAMIGEIHSYPRLFPRFAYFVYRHQEISIFVGIAIALAVDLFIVRRVWRAVSQPPRRRPRGQPSPASAPARAESKSERLETAPHFSRTAIAGACWVPFFLRLRCLSCV